MPWTNHGRSYLESIVPGDAVECRTPVGLYEVRGAWDQAHTPPLTTDMWAIDEYGDHYPISDRDKDAIIKAIQQHNPEAYDKIELASKYGEAA